MKDYLGYAFKPVLKGTALRPQKISTKNLRTLLSECSLNSFEGSDVAPDREFG